MDIFKKLGLVNDPDKQEEKVVETKSFPTENRVFTFNEEIKKDNSNRIFSQPLFDNKQSEKIGESIINNTNNINPYIDQLRKAYNEQFIKLNKPDVDFFEVYMAVSKAGNLDSLEALKMAYSMCSGMNSNLTWKMLDEQANQYAKSLMDAHLTLTNQGLNKMTEFRTKFSDEKALLEEQIKLLKENLKIAEENLSKINDKYEPQINEIKFKSEANNIAYSELMENITKVQNNIKQNL